jgi:ATP-binding cassette subfamily C (CFTR/MRP) protein 1
MCSCVSNCFNHATLSYLVPLFKIGGERPLTEEDVPILSKSLQATQCSNIFEKNWKKEIDSKDKNASLLRVLIHSFGSRIPIVFLISLCFITCITASPFFVYNLVRFFQGEEPQEIQNVPSGYFYAIGVWACFACVSFCVTHIYVNTTTIGHSSRIAVINAVYSKSLRLSATIGKEGGSGFVNLMTVDAERVWQGFLKLHLPFCSISCIVIGCIELYITAGFSGLAGLLVILLFLPLQAFIASAISKARRLMSAETDKRVQLQTEVLSGIRVVKAYGWENTLSSKIKKIRQKETNHLQNLLRLRAVNQVLTFLVPTVAMTVVFLTYSMYRAVDETVVFTSVAILSVIRPALLSLPKVVDVFAEFFVSIKRLNTFLLLEEKQQALQNENENGKDELINGAICLKNASFTWSAHDPPPPSSTKTKDESKNPESTKPKDNKIFSLKNISLNIEPYSFVCVVGSVGCGKTTLLLSLLGELYRTSGDSNVCGRIAFAGQTPWIQNASIRNGILFNEKDNQRSTNYTRALNASQLKEDIRVLVDGDDTIIGDKGVNLSGGQKQRIALARCLYLADECDIFIMDDVLSAVDVDVADKIVKEALLNLLKRTTRIAVLNSHYHVLKHSDWVIVMDKGEIIGQGKYDHIKNKFKDFLQLNDDDDDDDDDDGRMNKKEPNVTEESGLIERIVVNESTITTNTTTPTSTSNIELKQRNEKKNGMTATTELYKQEKRKVGVLDISLYAQYFAKGFCGNGTLALIIILFFTILTQTLCVLSDWWLSRWSRTTAFNLQLLNISRTIQGNDYYNISNTQLNVSYWQWSYFSWLPSIIMAASLRSGIFFWISLRSATLLHNTSMKRVLSGPLATFFDVTPVGRLINRFSKDQDSIDSALPSFLAELIESIIFLLSIVVLCAIYAPIFLVAMVPLSVIFYRFRKFFSSSSRELKRMQAVSRSPMYSMFSETLEGLSHIRAFNKSSTFLNRFQSLIDKNSRMFYYSFILIPYSILRMDLIGSCLILSVSLALVVFRENVDAASAGLAIAYSLQVMGRLQMTVTCSIETENHMVAVERLKELSTMPQEQDIVLQDEDTSKDQTYLQSKEWPTNGAIEFNDVHIRYRPNLPLVCQGVSVSVPPGKSVGVCGRTGSGKSTLLSALLRLIELEKGIITIDGIDISTIPLNTLRSNIAVIPQDALLFSGTIRDNLDPQGILPNDDLIKALKKTCMMDAAISLAKQALNTNNVEDIDVLNAIVTEGGANFSVGERQLLSIARGMLRGAKIVLLDEATSNVDGESDTKIQKVLRECFVGSTSLTIAHRIETISDSDYILVLDQGKVAEFAPPAELIAREGSIFQQLVNQSKE